MNFEIQQNPLLPREGYEIVIEMSHVEFGKARLEGDPCPLISYHPVGKP
jgi:hypothetical protein